MTDDAHQVNPASITPAELGGSPPPAFAPTRWTVVLRSRDDSEAGRAALGELCEMYYEPVLKFLRHEGRSDDTARELAHEFFARILARGGFGGANRERGRFRTYLLGALKHFLADRRDHDGRQKRGSGVAPISLDASGDDEGEGGLSPAGVPAPAATSAPDVVFDRDWGLTLMARSLEALRREMTLGGKPRQFELLKPWLMGDCEAASRAEAAEQLGLNDAAFKVAVHRLRKQFRTRVRAEIAQTLDDPAGVDEELRHLIAVLAYEHPAGSVPASG